MAYDRKAMDEDRPIPDIDERLPDGLRYTETTDESGPRRSRHCALHLDGEKEPVSSLVLHRLEVRFGGTSLPSEGVGGVQSRPEYRRRGYNTTLIRRALQGAAARVPAVFLYGIEGYYTRFGFTACLPEHSISFWVRRTRAISATDSWVIREAADDDLASVVELYNDLHANRPWTCVRGRETVALMRQETAWRPRPDVVLFERNGGLDAYAIIAHRPYGWNGRTFSVMEAGARDVGAARAILAEVGRRCRAEDLEQFTVDEPPDSMVGLAARALGCSITETTSLDGDGMGTLLDRPGVVNALSDELVRRTVGFRDEEAPPNLRTLDRALRTLADGESVPDDSALLRLLVGSRSWHESIALGECTATNHDRILRLMFPGGGTAALPFPYAHRIDRY